MDDNEENDLLEPDILALLRDPSLWQEPSAQLEDRVAAGIAEERRVVVPIGRARRAWPGRLAAAAIGAAAAAAVVLIAVPRNDDQQADASVAIAGTQLAPGISGTAGITIGNVRRAHPVLREGTAAPRRRRLLRGLAEELRGHRVGADRHLPRTRQRHRLGRRLDRRLPAAHCHTRARRRAEGCRPGFLGRSGGQRRACCVSRLST